jgi:hypothetical protein
MLEVQSCWKGEVWYWPSPRCSPRAQRPCPPIKKSTGSPQGAGNSNPKSVEAGEEYAKKMLLLMDTDKNGKVSKQEFMSFMEIEFVRLDINHDGKLDVKD